MAQLATTALSDDYSYQITQAISLLGVLHNYFHGNNENNVDKWCQLVTTAPSEDHSYQITWVISLLGVLHISMEIIKTM